jgi:hypothetical protein
MADVFLSYASQDRDTARAMAEVFSERGWSVFWDRTIPPGHEFDVVIGDALRSARCVVVLWSAASVNSRWVKEEAEDAATRGILVPAVIDDVPMPLGFRRLQAARLTGWPTSPDAKAEFTQLVAAISKFTLPPSPSTVIDTGPSLPVPPSPFPMAAADPRRAKRRLVVLLTAAASVAALLLLGIWLGTQPGHPSGSRTELSSGVQTVTVPNFLGTTSADVARTAELLGLTVSMSDGRGEQATFINGVVISQSPPAGTAVARPSRVELRIATRTVEVPTLVGTTLDSALSILDGTGLRVGRTQTQGVADAKPGTIVRQMPEPGGKAVIGSAVDVVVATAVRASAERVTILKVAPTDVSRTKPASLTVLLSQLATDVVAARVEFTATNDATGSVFGRFTDLVRNVDGSGTTTWTFLPGSRAPLGPATITARATSSGVTASARIKVVE